MTDEQILFILEFHKLQLSLNDFRKILPYVTVDDMHWDITDEFKVHIVSKEGNRIKCNVTISDIRR